MSVVRFYTDAPDALHYACRLVRRALAAGLQVGLRVPQAQAAQLDELLWTFDAASFLPHRRWAAGLAPYPGEVLLVAQAAQLPHRQVLINLGPDWDEAAPEFERVLEVVGQAPEAVQAGRTRFRAYKALGLELHHDTVA